MLDYEQAKKTKRCQVCGGFTYQNVELDSINDPIAINDSNFYGHIRCQPKVINDSQVFDLITVITNVDELYEFVNDVSEHGEGNEISVHINDRGVLSNPTFAIEKCGNTGKYRLEIRK